MVRSDRPGKGLGTGQRHRMDRWEPERSRLDTDRYSLSGIRAASVD
jgi:hypothetical protein